MDWRFGMLASVLANINRDPKKRPHPYEPEDFMPVLKGATPEKGDWRRMLRTVEGLVTRMGGQDLR